MSTAVMSMSVSNELQGIGSVLGSSDYQRSKTAASLRRTLSADMSSKKWLAKNGFCPLKKIASSEDLQFDDKTKKEEEPPGPGQSDIWSSIMTQKSSSSAPTPYVHPLAKQARSLSQQSLEICTESLGSETGSDGFSSVPPSETSDEEEEVMEQAEEVKEVPIVNKQEVVVVNYNSYAIKKSPSRSFPPPLPSLSQSGLHMRSHRVNGRLVVEAIPAPAPTPNYFQAQREGGRLLLTLANPKCNDLTNTDNTKEVTEEANKLKTKSSQKDEENEEAMFQEEEDFEEEEEDEDEEEGDDEEEIGQVMDRGIVLEMKVGQPTKILPTGVINVHRSALMMNKLMGLTNKDPSWSPKLEKMGDQTTLAQSLPPSQLVSRLIPSSAAASFNTYDYCWRTKSPGAAAPPTVCTHPLTQNPPTITKNNKFLMSKNMNPQDLVLMRGNKADYLVPVFKGCKEPRRSLLVWEPYCIATS